MASLLTACGGFLFAVLWMDLIFDVQVLRFRSAPTDLPEAVLASIAGYYHRATTTSRPMSQLIVAVMVVLFGALTYESARGQDPWWLLALSAVLAGIPIMLALTQTVPDAARLGRRAGGHPLRRAWRGQSGGIISFVPAACSRSWCCGLHAARQCERANTGRSDGSCDKCSPGWSQPKQSVLN